MSWLKFEITTHDKPEVWQIAQQLNLDPDAVVGKLLRIWAWFDQQTTDGNAPSVTRALLDRYTGVTGFVSAMIAAGWMTEADGVISLPNFERHNGQTAKTRAQTAKRVEKSRKSNAPCNARTVTPSVTPALPDKRREEKNDKSLSLSEGTTIQLLTPDVIERLNGGPLKTPWGDPWPVPEWVSQIIRPRGWGGNELLEMAILRYVRYREYKPEHGKLSAFELENMLRNAASNGWTPERCTKAIDLTIEKGWKQIGEEYQKTFAGGQRSNGKSSQKDDRNYWGERHSDYSEADQQRLKQAVKLWRETQNPREVPEPTYQDLGCKKLVTL
jgi:hypothetical protein